MDEDLQRQLRNLADEASPRPGSEEVVVNRAKTKRRLVGGLAGVALVALIGGLAGATTLLGDRDGIKPAPGPEETSECVSADYDLAVFVPEEDFHDKMVELNDHLRRHDAVASFRFVSAADALQAYLRENPDDTGPIPTFARRSQYRVTVKGGVDPHRLSKELAELGDGAFVPAQECAPSEPQQKFARYSFEAAKEDMSASGVVEVNSEKGTICLEARLSNNIVTAHVIDRHESDAERVTVVVDIPSRPDPSEDPSAVPSQPSTFCRSRLDRDLLQLVIDQPERFAIDFRRGPNDEPALVAELEPQGEAGERFELHIHCGLSVPLEFSDRVWLPVDPRLRRTHNPPEGFGGDENYDVGTMRMVDDDTIVYTSSEGVQIEYEPTNRRPEICE